MTWAKAAAAVANRTPDAFIEAITEAKAMTNDIVGCEVRIGELQYFLDTQAAEIERLRTQLSNERQEYVTTVEQLDAEIERLQRQLDNCAQARGDWKKFCEAENQAEIERLRAALVLIAEYRSISLAQEWPEGLHDVIRSMIDCAERALEPKP